MTVIPLFLPEPRKTVKQNRRKISTTEVHAKLQVLTCVSTIQRYKAYCDMFMAPCVPTYDPDSLTTPGVNFFYVEVVELYCNKKELKIYLYSLQTSMKKLNPGQC
jgi:hypothetical protein